MKKNYLIILFFFSFIYSESQENYEVLIVRKAKCDTTFYSEIHSDTIANFNSLENIIKPLRNNSGIWKDNILFTSDSFYVFSHWISERVKRLSSKHPKRFWRRIHRLTKKEKIKVYKSSYHFKESYTQKTIRRTRKTFCTITNNENGKVIFNKKMAVDSTVLSNDIIRNSSYKFISEFDSISLMKNLFRTSIVCNNSADFNVCLFRTLIANLENQFRISNPFGYFKSSNKIFKDSYELYFNFENYLINKAIIVKNRELKYYCNFKLINDSIHILNCPAPELSEGRITRKKNKIRFRYTSRSYNFYLKSPLYSSRNIFSPSFLSHYKLKVDE